MLVFRMNCSRRCAAYFYGLNYRLIRHKIKPFDEFEKYSKYFATSEENQPNEDVLKLFNRIKYESEKDLKNVNDLNYVPDYDRQSIIDFHDCVDVWSEMADKRRKRVNQVSAKQKKRMKEVKSETIFNAEDVLG